MTYFRVSLVPGPLPSDFIKPGSGLGTRLVHDQAGKAAIDDISVVFYNM